MPKLSTGAPMRRISVKKADIQFSKMIRDRDGGVCVRCGSRPHPQGLHCAHIFTRAIKKTRWDPENAVALCYGCHQYLDSHPAAKIEFFEKHLGQERMEALEARAHGRRNRV